MWHVLPVGVRGDPKKPTGGLDLVNAEACE